MANTKDYEIIIDFFKKVLLTFYYKLNLYSAYWYSKYELSRMYYHSLNFFDRENIKFYLSR